MRYGEIYSVVAAIPLGKVATYGQVAALAGLPGRARLVGYALAALTDETVPWHRVINSKGEISARTDGGPGAFVQRLRLEAEGGWSSMRRGGFRFLSISGILFLPKFCLSRRL